MLSFRHTKQTGKNVADTIFKVSCKRLFSAESVRYLGVKIHVNLNWKQQPHDIAKN